VRCAEDGAGTVLEWYQNSEAHCEEAAAPASLLAQLYSFEARTIIAHTGIAHTE